MPGLLDTLQADSPQGDALRNGLLQFGLALMQGKGNVGQILGQAGTQADTGMKAFQDRQFQDQLRKQQMADIARKRVMEGRQDKLYNEEEALRNLPTQFERTGQQMGNAAALEQTGNLSPFNSTAAVQSANAQPGYDYQGLINRYPQLPGGFDKAMALQAAIKKDTTPTIAPPGSALFSPGATKPFYTNPSNPHADSPDIQALARIYGADTPEFKQALSLMMDKKNHIVPQGFNRDANGKLTVDPVYDAAQIRWRGVAPTINAATRVALDHGVKSLTEEQNNALFGPNGAVTTGRLDPNRINSRTASIFAEAELANPGTDMSRISADIALSRNPTFRQRAMVAEVLPEIMQNMVDSGKKVGFHDVRTIGKMQAWVKGEFNDPDMTEYMTQRNDALMTIASVMRGVGMSDQAHRAEIEVSAPTMNPASLDSWLKGQMKSLAPRLKQNRAIVGAHPGARVGGAQDHLAMPEPFADPNTTPAIPAAGRGERKIVPFGTLK